MKSQNTKSSDKLKREVQQDIKKVNRDIDNIQGRMSPGKLIDDAIFYNHSRSPGAVFDHLKRNPIGTTLLSLGTLLLMEGETNSTYENSARTKLSSVKEKIQSHMPERDASSPGLVQKVKSKFDSKVSEIREGFEVRAHRKEITETFLETESNSEGFAGMDSGLTNKVTSSFASGKEKIKALDNTTFMALGAGLGVLTGASLPISEAEERLVQDKFQAEFSNFNSELREALNECSNIIKDLVITDVKDFSMKIF